ncbi:MAG: lysophospholipid acyltransferase family protein [Bacteroidetes bacterium]|nr:lysophospholipid acyltransferase family protein [Bacteroidota bacterium]
MWTHTTIVNRIEYFVFSIFVAISKLFNFYSYKYPGYILGNAFYYIIPIRKKVVLKNIKKAFPEYSEKRIKSIARKTYIHFATLFFEIFGMSSFKRERIKEYVSFDDLQKFVNRRKEGKAVILLTAHFGNWELGAVSMGIQLDEEIKVLAKPQRNELVSSWLDRNRETFGNKVVLLGTSVRELYKAVKESGIVGIVGDQRGPESGERVFFMGQPTSIYQGTAAIAVKSKTPIFVVMTVKQKNSRYIGHVEEIEVENVTGTDEEKIRKVTQAYMTILEKYARKNPEQWFWMHNIWKY